MHAHRLLHGQESKASTVSWRKDDGGGVATGVLAQAASAAGTGVAPQRYICPLERHVTKLYLSSLRDTHACLLF
jgi:hypothetical protein